MFCVSLFLAWLSKHVVDFCWFLVDIKGLSKRFGVPPSRRALFQGRETHDTAAVTI